MQCYKRYLLLLLCLVLCLTSFSVVASAEEITQEYYIYAQNWRQIDGTFTKFHDNFNFTPGDGENTTATGTWSPNRLYAEGRNIYFRTVYRVRPVDHSIMAKGNIKTTVSLENVYFTYLYQYAPNNQSADPFYIDTPTTVYADIYYSDGTLVQDIAVNVEDARKTHCLNLKLTFTPTKDVSYIEFKLNQVFTWDSDYSSDFSSYDKLTVTAYSGEFSDDNSFKLTVQQPSEEATILGGMWDSLKSGFSDLGGKISGGFSNVVSNLTSGFKSVTDKLTNGFKAMTDGITNVFNEIKNLPATLWGLIENGLKSLFIPDEDYMVSYKNKWEELLSDRMGAVYQVVQITWDSWDRISSSDTTNTIEIPRVNIPLPDNGNFSFGGYNVKIVPDGFDFLSTAVKTIVGIVASVAFINGLRKRYDEIMGVET